MKRKKEAEKAEEREGTVMVRGGAGHSAGHSSAVLVLCCYCMSAANDIHCPAVVQSYETGFQRIQEATGITDIDKLVNKFIEGWSDGSRGRQTLCQSRLVVAKTSLLPSPPLPSPPLLSPPLSMCS